MDGHVSADARLAYPDPPGRFADSDSDSSVEPSIFLSLPHEPSEYEKPDYLDSDGEPVEYIVRRVRIGNRAREQGRESSPRLFNGGVPQAEKRKKKKRGGGGGEFVVESKYGAVEANYPQGQRDDAYPLDDDHISAEESASVAAGLNILDDVINSYGSTHSPISSHRENNVQLRAKSQTSPTHSANRDSRHHVGGLSRQPWYCEPDYDTNDNPELGPVPVSEDGRIQTIASVHIQTNSAPNSPAKDDQIHSDGVQVKLRPKSSLKKKIFGNRKTYTLGDNNHGSEIERTASSSSKGNKARYTLTGENGNHKNNYHLSNPEIRSSRPFRLHSFNKKRDTNEQAVSDMAKKLLSKSERKILMAAITKYKATGHVDDLANSVVAVITRPEKVLIVREIRTLLPATDLGRYDSAVGPAEISAYELLAGRPVVTLAAMPSGDWGYNPPRRTLMEPVTDHRGHYYLQAQPPQLNSQENGPNEQLREPGVGAYTEDEILVPVTPKPVLSTAPGAYRRTESEPSEEDDMYIQPTRPELVHSTAPAAYRRTESEHSQELPDELQLSTAPAAYRRTESTSRDDSSQSQDTPFPGSQHLNGSLSDHEFDESGQKKTKDDFPVAKDWRRRIGGKKEKYAVIKRHPRGGSAGRELTNSLSGLNGQEDVTPLDSAWSAVKDEDQAEWSGVRCSIISTSEEAPVWRNGKLRSVYPMVIPKDKKELGIVVSGGRGSSKQKYLQVDKVMNHGACAGYLEVGMQLHRVNDILLEDLNHSDAVKVIKSIFNDHSLPDFAFWVSDP